MEFQLYEQYDNIDVSRQQNTADNCGWGQEVQEEKERQSGTPQLRGTGQEEAIGQHLDGQWESCLGGKVTRKHSHRWGSRLSICCGGNRCSSDGCLSGGSKRLWRWRLTVLRLLLLLLVLLLLLLWSDVCCY
jgi:hypothetical protein